MIIAAPIGAALEAKHRLQVIRPANPQLALDTARSIIERQNGGVITKEAAAREHQAIIHMQDYVFVGWLKQIGDALFVVDQDDKTIEPIKPGDSFVSGLPTRST